MDCARCDTLRRALDDLEREYAACRGLLNRVRESGDAEKYNRAKVRVEEARLDYEMAHFELDRHRRAHA